MISLIALYSLFLNENAILLQFQFSDLEKNKSF